MDGREAEVKRLADVASSDAAELRLRAGKLDAGSRRFERSSAGRAARSESESDVG